MTEVQTRQVARSLGVAEDSAVAAQYAQIFSLLDKDQDGWVSKRDLMVGLNLPAESVDGMISAAGGGGVDVLAFVQVMSNPTSDLGEERRRQSIVILSQSSDSAPIRRDSTALLVAKLDQMDKKLLDPLLEVAPPTNLRDSAPAQQEADPHEWTLQSPSAPKAPPRKGILSKGRKGSFKSSAGPPPAPEQAGQEFDAPPVETSKPRRFKGLAGKVSQSRMSQPRMAQSLRNGKRHQQQRTAADLMNPASGSSVSDLSTPVATAPPSNRWRDSSVMLLEKVHEMERRHENGGGSFRVRAPTPPPPKAATTEIDENAGDENSAPLISTSDNKGVRPVDQQANSNKFEQVGNAERVSRIPPPSSFARR